MESIIQDLFLYADRSVRGAPGAALFASFLWGIFSILLSPCHLSSVPLVVAVVSGRRDLPLGKALALASVFALGILVTLGLVSVLAFAVGFAALQALGPWGTVAIGLLFLLAALTMWGVPLLPFLDRFAGMASPGIGRRGMAGVFFLGLVFGLSLGPCTMGFMMPVLGAAGALAPTRPGFAGGMLALFALGHCGFIAAAGGSFHLVSRLLRWNESTRTMDRIKRILAILLAAIGFALLYGGIRDLGR